MFLIRRLALLIVFMLAQAKLASAQSAIDYDIVYVKWPRRGDATVVLLPQGEHPYNTEVGCDLMLRHPDGTDKTLVDCSTCCVQDPAVSFDGQWVYYTKIADGANELSNSLLYKMKIGGPNPDYREIQLTYVDPSLNNLHKGANDAASNPFARFGIRDMGPCPLPGGKVVFTSNRVGTVPFIQDVGINVSNAWQALAMGMFIMDDHDGTLNNATLQNLRRLGFGNLHLVQHPTMLADGRLLFSNWDDAGGKFTYAMTTLYTMNPDGSNLRAFTEPHDHHKNVDHFATQLGDGTIVTAQYYPSFDFGFGILARMPVNAALPAYTLQPSPSTTNTGARYSYRNFDNVSWDLMTPHTTGTDVPAPNLSGKYSMPAAAPNGALLVAYSPGGVNHFSAVNPTPDPLDSGIYLIPNASQTRVTDPNNNAQLVRIQNSPDSNEIWPRPVVPYQRIHGITQPQVLPNVTVKPPSESRLLAGEPAALVGSSSLYNRQSAPTIPDTYSNSEAREIHTGSWTIQGTDTGIVQNSDIYGVRVVMVTPNVYRNPTNKYKPEMAAAHAQNRLYLPDARNDAYVRGYASANHENWKILGEFPVRKNDTNGNAILDAFGQPDTSFLVKIPADTPFFFQGIDKNGMTLFSELTWRSAAAGEVRNDCGGCHAHSIAPLPFANTAAGRKLAIQAAGLSSTDSLIANGVWDLTQGKVPLVTTDSAGNPTVTTLNKGSYGIEYFRDILPILQNRCLGCHKSVGNTTGTDLVFDGQTSEDDPYFRLILDRHGKYGGIREYKFPQLSRYVRVNQARQSFLIWKLSGARLDGRTNATWSDDIDFTPHSQPSGITANELRTLARWIDLGAPRDFTDTFSQNFRYTDDNLLPVLNIAAPLPGINSGFNNVARVGFYDTDSGIDWSSVKATLYRNPRQGLAPEPISVGSATRLGNVMTFSLPTILNQEAVLQVEAKDLFGNINRGSIRFTNSSAPPPAQTIASPTNLNVRFR